MSKLERLQKRVVDTEAAFDDAEAAFDDAVCADATADAATHAAYDDWDDKRAALVKARLELKEYLKEQQDNG